jgi:DNA repair ATPase RecN
MIPQFLKALGVRAILALVGTAAITGVIAHYRHVINDRAELRTELSAALTERDSFKQAMAISQEATRRYAAQLEADRRALDDLRSRLNEEDLREWAEQPLPPALICRWGAPCGE